MISIIKDLISFFMYLLVTPFYRNKNAILVYHSVNDLSPGNDPNKMSVSPQLFEKQIKHLSKSRNDYMLSFDDGFEDVYLNAFPILKKHKIKTILFITTDYVDSKIKVDSFFNNKYSPRPLTWDQIKEMYSSGVKIGSHTLTHANMAHVDEEVAYREAFASRKRISDLVGCNVDFFSYPFGNLESFNKNTEEILKKIGYKKAYTNIMGMDNSATQPFVVRRIRIYDTDNMFRFKMKIKGAYNWVDQLSALFCSTLKMK